MMDIGIASQLVRSPRWEKTQTNHRHTTCSTNWIHPTFTEDMLFYEGIGDGQDAQDVHVLLMEGSTEEDPIVRIKGHSYSGEFDFTCHVKDIDPRSASYAEMCALFGWQRKINPREYGDLVYPTPLGMEIGNVLQRQNFVSRSSSYLASKKFGPSIAEQTKELLALYDQVIQSSRFPEDDMRTYSAYRRAADEALMELLNLV